jgi:hypothetical protein
MFTDMLKFPKMLLTKWFFNVVQHQTFHTDNDVSSLDEDGKFKEVKPSSKTVIECHSNAINFF